MITYVDVPATPGIYVVCDDGRTRHERGAITNLREAHKFAEWGHACAATHTIVTVLPVGEP